MSSEILRMELSNLQIAQATRARFFEANSSTAAEWISAAQ
jgi:hypothetical protein